jgi:hypothetical protein
LIRAISEVFACWQDRRNVAGASGDTDLYFAEVSSDGGRDFIGHQDFSGSKGVVNVD